MSYARTISTPQEYQSALRRIDELMDARPGTPEGDELERLSALVEQYEKRQFPIRPPEPIEATRFRIEQSGRACE